MTGKPYFGLEDSIATLQNDKKGYRASSLSRKTAESASYWCKTRGFARQEMYFAYMSEVAGRH